MDLDKEIVLILSKRMKKFLNAFENDQFDKFVKEVEVWTRESSDNLNKKYGPESIFRPTTNIGDLFDNE